MQPDEVPEFHIPVWNFPRLRNPKQPIRPSPNTNFDLPYTRAHPHPNHNGDRRIRGNRSMNTGAFLWIPVGKVGADGEWF